jgi:hypothetical protein
MDIKEQIVKVKEYARAHYEDGDGWDYVIETMEDKDIERELSGNRVNNEPPTKTAEEAIELIGVLVGLWAEADNW